MTLDSVYGPYAVGVGATVIGGVSQQSIAPGVETGGGSTSNEIFSRIAYMQSQKIAPTFTTRAISTALSGVTVMGKDLSTSNLVLYLQKFLAGGGRAPSGHMSFTASRGIVVPRSLTIPHQGEATLVCEALLYSADGDTCPLTIATGASLPALSAQDEAYSLGTVVVGGVTIAGAQQVSVDFGIDLASEGEASKIWDVIAFIQGCNPRITIEGLDAAAVSASGVPMEGLDGASTVITLLKREHGGSFAGSGDLTLTVNHGFAHAGTIASGSHGGRATTGIEVICTYDGTNNPIVIA